MSTEDSKFLIEYIDVVGNQTLLELKRRNSSSERMEVYFELQKLKHIDIFWITNSEALILIVLRHTFQKSKQVQ